MCINTTAIPKVTMNNYEINKSHCYFRNNGPEPVQDCKRLEKSSDAQKQTGNIARRQSGERAELSRPTGIICDGNATLVWDTNVTV